MRHGLRHIVAGLALASPLLLSGCSDQPTEAPSALLTPASGRADVVDPVGSCPASSIENQIKDLAPAGGLRTSLLAKFKSIPSKVGKNGTAAYDKMFGLVDVILDAYYAGQFGGTSPVVQAKVLALINSLYCIVRLDSPALPAGSLGEDGVVEVVGPTTNKAVVTPNGQAGVDINPGDVPIVTVIVITRLSDETGPLNTRVRQFPPFYHFSSTPEVEFNNAVVTGICVEDPGVPLLLAHNVGEEVEILPRANPNFLDCDNFEEFSSSASNAARAWTWAKQLMLPAKLHASAALLTTGVGGTTKKFSPFGAVEEGFDYASTGYRYLVLSSPEDSPPEGFEDPSFLDTAFSTGDAGFGFNLPANSCPLIIQKTVTPWPAGNSEEPSQILLRKFFSTSSSSVRIRVAIDNDIRVFVDGTEITATGGTTVGGFLQHDGCPTEDSFTLTAGGLDPSVEHLLAIQGLDRGGSSYVDALVEPFIGD